jgi:hypothetical protein
MMKEKQVGKESKRTDEMESQGEVNDTLLRVGGGEHIFVGRFPGFARTSSCDLRQGPRYFNFPN